MSKFYYNKLKRFFFAKFLGKTIFDERLRIYLTLHCNFQCSYCVNNYEKDDFDGFSFPLRSTKDWAKTINRLQKDVIFTGGEPFVYSKGGENVIDLVNQISSHINVQLYTNLGVDISKKIEQLERPIDLYVSYHSKEVTPNVFLKNIDAISTNIFIKYHIHLVDTCGNLEHNNTLIINEEMKQRGITIEVDQDQDFEGSRREFKKKAFCKKCIYLIAPDGTRFHCVGKLMRNVNPMENIIDEKITSSMHSIDCDEYGYCAACDWLGDTVIKPLDGGIMPSEIDQKKKNFDL